MCVNTVSLTSKLTLLLKTIHYFHSVFTHCIFLRLLYGTLGDHYETAPTPLYHYNYLT